MDEVQRVPLEICAQAEDQIREAQRLLLEPRPDALERARAELIEVISALRAVGSKRPLPAELREPLKRIRAMASLLARQIEHASNLYMGLVQLRLGNGYTRQGLPFVQTGARNSIEG
jgi:hypothetical protein